MRQGRELHPLAKMLFATLYLAILLMISRLSCCRSASVLTTEVFEIPITPDMFNWTYEGIRDQFVYQPSLKDAPDLPNWINYIYSYQHHVGFLYGVPPDKEGHVYLDLVALNRKNYETRKHVLSIHVGEKRMPARYEVQMKIDNLNVDDMFDPERMDRLKDVFRRRLWKQSDDDLYVTFLASAIKLGARLPVNPNEGEGVVLRLGSRESLSQELIELQEEVRPLWKIPACPRDFKRTSVERIFRDAGFQLDWCAFRLVEDDHNKSSMQQHSRTNVGNRSNQLIPDEWKTLNMNEVPERSYQHELLFTILVPMFIMTLLAFFLSLILCFNCDSMDDPLSEVFFANLFHICTDKLTKENTRTIEQQKEDDNNETIQTAANSQRQLTTPRDVLCVSPDSNYLSYANSPTNTINKGVHCRPSPPPYMRPKFKPEF